MQRKDLLTVLQPQGQTEQPPNYKPSERPPAKTVRPPPVSYEDEEEEIQEVMPVKTETGAVEVAKDDMQSFEENYADYSGYEEAEYEGGGNMMAAHTQAGLEISKGESPSLSYSIMSGRRSIQTNETVRVRVDRDCGFLECDPSSYVTIKGPQRSLLCHKESAQGTHRRLLGALWH